MAVRKSKPPKSSPIFERINLERLDHCKETTQSAQRTIETSKKITEESRELLETIRKHRRKSG